MVVFVEKKKCENKDGVNLKQMNYLAIRNPTWQYQNTTNDSLGSISQKTTSIRQAFIVFYNSRDLNRSKFG